MLLPKEQRYHHLVIGRDKSHSKSDNKHKQGEIIQIVDCLIDNIFVLCSLFDALYDFCMKTMFGSSLHHVVLHEGSCLIYVICVCLRIMMSNTFCVVVLFCFSSYCVPCATRFSGLSVLIAPSVFSGLSVLIAPSVFSNVYFLSIHKRII